MNQLAPSLCVWVWRVDKSDFIVSVMLDDMMQMRPVVAQMLRSSCDSSVGSRRSDLGCP